MKVLIYKYARTTTEYIQCGEMQYRGDLHVSLEPITSDSWELVEKKEVEIPGAAEIAENQTGSQQLYDSKGRYLTLCITSKGEIYAN
jgi:hypothetical protein